MVTDISEFTDVKMKIQFICQRHGMQSMIIDNFIRGHKCIECSYENRSANLKLTKDYVKEKIESKGDIWVNPDEYTNCQDKNLKIKCSCGKEFMTSFVNFDRHNVTRCKTCSQKESVGELRIKNFLLEHNIQFEQEKRFDGCRDQKSLPFDFYLPTHRTCVEFDGKQHFVDIYGKDTLLQTQKHDCIKNKYCEENSIILIRIPYWEGNNIDQILSSKIL